MSTRSQRLANVEKAKHDLNILEKEYKPTFKDAVMALRVLKATMNIRENTKEEVKVQGSVENIKKAVTMEETSEQLTQKSKDLFNELFGDE